MKFSLVRTSVAVVGLFSVQAMAAQDYQATNCEIFIDKATA